MGGGGEGNFQLARIFFFLPTACAGIFFSGETLCTNFFFQTNIAFLSVKSRFIIYFAFNKLFYTHNRSKDTDHFLIMCARSFRECTERGGNNPEWTASLCIFAVPTLWNSSVIKVG